MLHFYTYGQLCIINLIISANTRLVVYATQSQNHFKQLQISLTSQLHVCAHHTSGDESPVVKIPTGSQARGTIRETCTTRFKEWWDADMLHKIIKKMNPTIVETLKGHGADVTNVDKLAEILYDVIGPNFLRDVDDDRSKRKWLLENIIKSAIAQKCASRSDILDAAHAAGYGWIRGIDRLVYDTSMSQRLARNLAKALRLPMSVAEKSKVARAPRTEIVMPHSRLNPLYDYQYSAGTYIRGMLEGVIEDGGSQVKRRLFAVPTGSGKTRMVAETIIEWFNDEKPSKNAQQADSKFVLWIAQSSELCEQALSAFQSVFESFGRRGTLLHLHRFWGTGGKLPDMGMDDLLGEKGIIIATIQSLHKIFKSEPERLESLAKITSCIIIDEAHHSVATSYSEVLRKMGFNWNRRKSEVSELGIILIGLTATPFRGSGETERLKNRYDDVYYPDIHYVKGAQNARPHALVDCPAIAYAGEQVRILGERSYDRDGFIPDGSYAWRISRKYDSEHTQDQKNAWVFEGKKNISFRFPEPGAYKITLVVHDNEGDSGSATVEIIIKAKPDASQNATQDIQRRFYGNLIRRKILCEVYHKILPSERYELGPRESRHLREFKELGKDTLRSIGSDERRNSMIISEIQDIRKNGRKKILFFGCSVEHARQIAMLLKVAYNMRVGCIDSRTDMDARARTIEEFRTGDLEVLCNFGVLTTGFDAPNIDCVFVGRPIHSTLLYTQMIGRGMRGVKSGGTDDVIIIDIDDNFQLADTGGNDEEDTQAELGWKIYQTYWKSIDAINVSNKRKEVSQLPQVLSYSCATCGITARGLEAIQEEFGADEEFTGAGVMADNGGIKVMPTCKKCHDNESEPTSVITSEPRVNYDYNNKNQVNIVKPVADADYIDKEFARIKNQVYMHIPTTRQFEQSTDAGVRKAVTELYGGYSGYLNSKNISITGDRALEDALYDEYFEMIQDSEGDVQGRDIPHKYGRYRPEDYEECFGTIERFENMMYELAYRMVYADQRITKYDLHCDYAGIVKRLGREPHFEDVRIMSNVGIEYYLNSFGTLGKFKRTRNVNGKEFVLRNLKSDYNRIKEMLRVSPGPQQMLAYSAYGYRLLEMYPGEDKDAIDYASFLQAINVNDTIDDTDVEALRMRIMNEMLSEFTESARTTTISVAIADFIKSDPAPYQEWFGSRYGFVEMLARRNPEYVEEYKRKQGEHLSAITGKRL